MSLRVGQETDIKVDRRYVQHVRSHSMGDAYDALVELITNADDSYGRLFRAKSGSRDGGDILIEYLEQRRGRPSLLVVRDRAEGMDDRDMEAKLGRIGAYSTSSGTRGYMGRGAKDCTALGDLVVESIKEDRYYRCRITHGLKFKLEARRETATDELRDQLGIPHGNGTSVTLELLPEVRMPRIDNLAAELPWHYALRDVMAADSLSRVLLRKLGEKDSSRIVHRRPEGELVAEETFKVDGYPGAQASLRIWRSPEPLEESKVRFERYGLLIKGKRAVHECSLLADDFKKDPAARRYFGRLDCRFLDELLDDFETRLVRGETPRENNPCLVIDPNRRFGLERRHPFVKALLQIPIERLRGVLAREREREKAERRQVTSSEMRNRLARLAKLAGRFLQEQLDELEELTIGEDVDAGSFAKTGMLIYPTYFRVGVGRERTLTYYVKDSLLANDSPQFEAVSDSPDALKIMGSPVTLRRHHSKADRCVGNFRVQGIMPKDGVIVSAHVHGLPTAEALAHVIEEATEDRVFQDSLEFERSEYRVRQGRHKTVHLYAKYPDLVAEETDVKLTSSDPTKVGVRGRARLVPVSGTNYAEATVEVVGRTLNAVAVITAEVNGRTAKARIRVIDRPEEKGVPFDIDIRDEDFSNFRAVWAVHESKPNLLLISARHDSLRRYLGNREEDFPGQNTPLCRALIAEIVAESVCRKALALEAKERPFDFRWAELGQPDLIVDDVAAQLQKRLRAFLGKAHQTMLTDEDLGNAQAEAPKRVPRS